MSQRELPDKRLEKRTVQSTQEHPWRPAWGVAGWRTTEEHPIGPDAAAALDVLGEDHVSLGSDYDGSVGTGFDVSELPALTHALLDEGLSETQIAKVMGGNMFRVLRARLSARNASPKN